MTMTTRVTTAQTSLQLLNNVQTAQRALNRVQGQVASNKRIQIASDDPLGSIGALSNRAELRRSQQLGRNADRATEWLNANDRASQSTVDILTQARALLIQANSGAMDPTARQAIANQLLQIRDSLVGVANTKVGDRSIFGGTAAGDAYSAGGTYQGDTGNMTLSIETGTAIQVSQNGPAVFGVSNPGNPIAGDVFEMLTAVATAVSANDRSTMTTGLGAIDSATTTVQNFQTEMGAKLNRIETVTANARLRQGDLSEQISKVEDIDLAQAAVELKAKQNAYEGALAVAAKLMQTSLLDFLR